MAFLPKSKITIKSAQEGELIYSISKKSFIGPYIKSSTGKKYAGTNNLILGPELSTPPSPLETNLSLYGKSLDVYTHNILKKEIKNYTNNTINIQGTKPLPTEKNYKKGYYTRYFTKRINNLKYKEISKDTYDSILKKEGKYDHHLNEIGKLNWHLIDNVFKKNSTSIKIATRRFPNIVNLFPVINEFYRSSPISTLQNNLHTSGKELYYADGKEYIGNYHIHPEKGPMEGAQHLSTPHAKLYYLNQLPNTKDTSYKDFLEKYTTREDNLLIIDKRPISNTPLKKTNSSGGGGGY